MPVTRHTPWRHIGAIPYETWKQGILAAGGLPEYAAREVWEALGDDSALAYQQLREESSLASDFDAIPADWWNAWNLQIAGVGIKNRNAVEAAKAWRNRVYDPNYKGGVYANTTTIEEFFNVYAPEWDGNDTEAYIRESVDGINRLGYTASPPSQFATWRQQIDLMFGPGRNVTQGYGVDSGAADYSYGAGHGLDGHQHTGLDVGMPYGTKMYSPSEATVVCGGTGIGAGAHGLSCDAFNDWGDGNGTGSKKGVGRIELLFPDGRSLIYGHSRTSAVKPGDKVKRGQFIGTSGGMNGAHIHLEAREFRNGDYWLIDPKNLLETLPITPGIPVEPGEQVALPIRQMMIPAGNGNRPGTKLNDEPLWITIHETANYDNGSDAEMHAIFVRNGGGSDGVSFHGTVDDGEFIQLLPFDEIGYHAGDGCNSRSEDKGCFASIAFETCVNADSSWSRTKENLIDACVAVIKGDGRLNFAGRQGKFSPSRLAQHNKWSGKNCPARIRGEGTWGSIAGKITSLAAGTPTEPTPPPAATEFFPGLDEAVAKRLFGQAKGEDGLTYRFDKNGPVSKTWMARGEVTGQWPALVEVWVYDNGRRKYFHFEDGYTILDPAGEDNTRVLKK
jgi:murein DD-endopeptidase MepM/ murein hydrolase activator NlpD